MAQVVAVLGRGVVPADQPFLLADDLGVLRGDGIFETANVRNGKPFLLDEHLARMARSAVRMELDLPDLTALRELAAQACEAFGDSTEGALRIICTRGLEAGSAPTVYATVNPVAESAIQARRDGLKLTVLSLGYDADTRSRAPWLLGGAKCLSYAVAMAAQRHAKAAGYDDVLWRSEDGLALEGPTSTLVWQVGTTLYTVPTDTGILPGTTAKFLFDHASEAGLTTGQKRIRIEELMDAEGVWMASSVRGVAPVLSLDGEALKQSSLTGELARIVGFPLP